jgi:hypothetical protein
VRLVPGVRAGRKCLGVVLLELSEEAINFQAGVEEVHGVNALRPRHSLENPVLVEAVDRHPLVDVAGDLLVRLS